jgi:hypothetical protein
VGLYGVAAGLVARSALGFASDPTTSATNEPQRYSCMAVLDQQTPVSTPPEQQRATPAAGPRVAGAGQGSSQAPVPARGPVRGFDRRTLDPLGRTLAAAVAQRTADSVPDPHLSGVVSTAQLVSNVRREHVTELRRGGHVRFRVPTAAAVTALMNGTNVSEANIKRGIRTALTRMRAEHRLRTADTVDVIMGKVFPAAGTFDAAEYANAVNLADRSKVYENVADAQAVISAHDRPLLRAAIQDAADLMQQARGMNADLVAVFGASKVAAAQEIYRKGRLAALQARANLNLYVHTDYNLDDPEIGLGGWANFATQKVHLTAEVARVDDADESAFTIVHECSHLADNTVDDLGYYGSQGFEAMSEAEKIANAAHFEEIPRRIQNKSLYAGQIFTPGQVAGGAAPTKEEKVKRAASEHMRKAWDKAVDVHIFLRKIREQLDANDRTEFVAKYAKIKKISELEGLTIHEQTGVKEVTLLDIVLAEGIAHAISAIGDEVDNQHLRHHTLWHFKSTYVKEMVQDSIAAYGELTGTSAGDKKLLDWLVAQYQKAI